MAYSIQKTFLRPSTILLFRASPSSRFASRTVLPGIDQFQRPLLPFFRHRQDLIRDPAYRSVRHSQPVDILNMRLNITGRHAFRIHGQDLLFDILTDAGLVLFQKLRFKLPFSVTGNRNLDIAETGSQIFAAVAVPAVVRSLVLVVVFAVTKILIQFSLQTILHEFGNGFLEQVLDVVHAVDVRHLQQFTNLCPTGFFFRASILSGHIFSLHPDASILHLSGGLHNCWDGLILCMPFCP